MIVNDRKIFLLRRNESICCMLLKSKASTFLAREAIVLEVIKNAKAKFIKKYIIIFIIVH